MFYKILYITNIAYCHYHTLVTGHWYWCDAGTIKDLLMPRVYTYMYLS